MREAFPPLSKPLVARHLCPASSQAERSCPADRAGKLPTDDIYLFKNSIDSPACDYVPPDHQHQGRAARGRSSVPAAARDRWRLQYERDHHAAHGRVDRLGAADDPGRRDDARPDLDSPIRATREVSHDMTGRSRIRLANEFELGVLDIQYEYLNQTKDFTDKNAPTR